ncbi:TatD family hydrolase [Candidatus Omnitrophus magneticus]|uniref:TatD family hydrolase n=1 Tax=Candidatus Omnitrophus magneticus TaxID=1609969 RepID=A0A0F0CNN7_9BACT|nr:TatD family hydrolase [Candidatus Omnitrophus magneticus]
MFLVDTHAHLNLPEYKEDIDIIIKRAESAGVKRIIVPGVGMEENKKSLFLSKEYSSCFSAFGIHPNNVTPSTIDDITEIRALCLDNNKVAAIGEIGLDYYRKYTSLDIQKTMFKEFLTLAGELDFPVILHSRNAEQDFWDILSGMKNFKNYGVVHCFSGDKDFLKKILSLGFHVSFTGVVTFKNSDMIKSLVREVPLERLLLETDSPYMAPEPMRGKICSPDYIVYMLETYAKIYNCSKEEIAEITTSNANNLFKLGIENKGKIAYPIRNSLYLNITNRCTNRCSFCTREKSDFVKGHELKLDREPSLEEIVVAMGDVSKYDEIVFCGFGEPTLRIKIIKEVSAYLKKHGKKVRLVTNGQAELINKRPVAKEMKGLIDTVSVSLNAPVKESYDKLCYSVFGEDAFNNVVSFAQHVISEGISVEITCLDMIGEEKIAVVKNTARELGASFRLRYFDVVG